MLHVIKGFDTKKRGVLDMAFRFRHEAFVEEAGWENLRSADQREIDQFDTEETIHIVVTDERSVRAYSRLNPTTKPHVLSHVYPHLASQGLVTEAGAWEWSRMGTAKHARTDGKGWSGPIGLLFRCVTYVALINDIETLVWQAHPVWITRASELGFQPVPLGLPVRIGGDRVVAAKMSVEPNILQQMDLLNLPSTQGLPAFTQTYASF